MNGDWNKPLNFGACIYKIRLEFKALLSLEPWLDVLAIVRAILVFLVNVIQQLLQGLDEVHIAFAALNC